MKVLLIRPFSKNYQSFFDISGPVEPTNLLYIAAPLVKNNITVKILDFEMVVYSQKMFRQYLQEYSPDVVGISCFSSNINFGHLLAKFVKRFNSKIVIVVGGPHVTCLPRETMERYSFFDVGVLGEGEFIFLDLIKSIQNQIPIAQINGIIYREDNLIVQTGDSKFVEDLDQIPLPPRDLLEMELYLTRPQAPGIWKRALNLYTTRGCPFSCHFCANKNIHGQKVRFHSLEHVFAEIAEAVEKYKIEHVIIRDSNFTINAKRAKDFCLKFHSRFPFLTFSAETKVNLINRGLLKYLKNAGCTKISFGVESGSPRVLRQINKQITIPQVSETFKLCKEVGIPAQAFFMIGHPHETLLDLRRTQQIIRKIDPNYLFVSIAIPLPGTEYYKEFSKIADKVDLSNFLCYEGDPTWQENNIDPRYLQKFQTQLYREYLLSIPHILNFIKDLRSFSQVKYYIKAFFGLARFLRIIPF